MKKIRENKMNVKNIKNKEKLEQENTNMNIEEEKLDKKMEEHDKKVDRIKKEKRNFIIISSALVIFIVIAMHVSIRNLIGASVYKVKEGLDIINSKGIIVDPNMDFELIKLKVESKIYWVRAVLKLIILLFPILLYSSVFKEKTFDFLSFKNKVNHKTFLYTFICILVVVLGFLGIKNFLDMDMITKKIQAVSGSNLNYIFIFVYIFTMNAFLEEIFFRGFLYINLSKYMKSTYANIYSSLLFGIYHIGIVGELSLRLAVLSVIGLFIVGFVFNRFNKKRKNIYTSYILHSSANIAINTIGLVYLFL